YAPFCDFLRFFGLAISIMSAQLPPIVEATTPVEHARFILVSKDGTPRAAVVGTDGRCPRPRAAIFCQPVRPTPRRNGAPCSPLARYGHKGCSARRARCPGGLRGANPDPRGERHLASR